MVNWPFVAGFEWIVNLPFLISSLSFPHASISLIGLDRQAYFVAPVIGQLIVCSCKLMTSRGQLPRKYQNSGCFFIFPHWIRVQDFYAGQLQVLWKKCFLLTLPGNCFALWYFQRPLDFRHSPRLADSCFLQHFMILGWNGTFCLVSFPTFGYPVTVLPAPKPSRIAYTSVNYGDHFLPLWLHSTSKLQCQISSPILQALHYSYDS